MHKGIQDESGRALVIALVALAVGTLLVIGFIQYVSTSQLATRAAREQTINHYSADAGVEHVIWRLANEDGFTQTVTTNSPVTYTITINEQTVVITVTRVLTP
jgi:Tfp pilus assembly protein PilX